MTYDTSPSAQATASSRIEVGAEGDPTLAARNVRQVKHQQEFSLSEKKAKYWKDQELAYNCQKLTGKKKYFDINH
jgi:hypothetical protein